jgi:hypothetical protein
MRYAQGGGLTAEAGGRRERVRLAAVERFEQRVPSAVIAAELRVVDGGSGGGGRVWTLTRESPDFTPLDFQQRLDGDWEHDFALTYRRAG